MARMCFLVCGALLLAASSPFSMLAQQSAEEKMIEVPFVLAQNEIILVVNVNNKGPFNMALDTGTDPSAIDLTTAKQIGLKLDAKGRRGDGGGTEVNLGYKTRLPVVEIGSLTARNIRAVAIDLSHVRDLLGMTLHGVFGHSLLNHRIVQIDYPKRVVRFYSI